MDALETRMGAQLDEDFKAFLYENTNTIAIDDAMHLMRRTTGGKNTPAQIAADAADLRLAFEADADDFRRLAIAQDIDSEEVEAAIEAMRQLNEELGIYTWVQ